MFGGPVYSGLYRVNQVGIFYTSCGDQIDADNTRGSTYYIKNNYHRAFDTTVGLDCMGMIGKSEVLSGTDGGVFKMVWGTFYAISVLDRGSL